MADGLAQLAGTAFFLGRINEDDETYTGYVVTAGHVIHGIRDRGVDEVLIRLNLLPGGSQWVRIDLASWYHHPDPAVDVAVFPSALPNHVDHLAYPLTAVGTEDVLRRQEIDVGSEVFVVGLFAHHFGLERNIPIVRMGNVAALREERVGTALGPMDAYLIEARSIGGLSGSPVFARTPLVRVSVDGEIQFNRNPFGSYFLVGLIHGHFDAPVDAIDVGGREGTSDHVNVGIAIVVPVEKILETIAICPTS